MIRYMWVLMGRTFLYSLFFGSILAFLCTGCFRSSIPIDTEMPLQFSVDTVFFDTVFTTKGSATRLCKVYNPSSEDLFMDVSLSENTRFRVNVDGVAEGPFTDILVPAGDSIYVFLEVTIDPNAPLSVSPFVIEEELTFTTEYARQQLLLIAWGQNANYITNDDRQGRITLLSCGMRDIRLDDPKPYVVFGILVIDSCTLRLPPGARLYIHGGVENNNLGIYNDGLLFFGSAGTLRSEGTAENPVIIEGDRLEPEFSNVAGQWSGIRFGPGSSGHRLAYTEVRNAVNAVVLDSASSAEISKSTIWNSSALGVLARHATLRMDNTLVAFGSRHPVELTFGGDYQLDFCTIVNYGYVSEALVATDFTCVNATCDPPVIHPLHFRLRNSIILGSTADQIALGNAGAEQDFNLDWQHNLVRIDELLERVPDFFTICDPCWNFDLSSPLFVAPNGGNYTLDSLAQAEGRAKYLSEFPTDRRNILRMREEPDLGCYERQ